MINEKTKNKNILITGGAGFIGSNFIPYFLIKHPSYQIINFDLLTYAGDLGNLREIEDHPNYTFIQGDIADREAVEKVFDDFNITDVIHFAAESHVDNSINKPDSFIQTNILGTFNLIEVARRTWLKAPGEFIQEYIDSRFHHISTDEVYGSLGDTGKFTEDTPYAPNSPYSASKASADLLVRSYHETYGLNTVTTNCSNNYGPKQHQEKLIPTIIRKALALEPIPIYGDGTNVRDWLYVMDHCQAIDLVFHQGVSGETYNIGGNTEKTNILIAEKICDLLDQLAPRYNSQLKSYKDLITFVKDRPGHDKRYAVDITKIKSRLGWEPEESFESGIEKTVRWYLRKYKT